jgi:hypothetical protein
MVTCALAFARDRWGGRADIFYLRFFQTLGKVFLPDRVFQISEGWLLEQIEHHKLCIQEHS